MTKGTSRGQAGSWDSLNLFALWVKGSSAKGLSGLGGLLAISRFSSRYHPCSSLFVVYLFRQRARFSSLPKETYHLWKRRLRYYWFGLVILANLPGSGAGPSEGLAYQLVWALAWNKHLSPRQCPRKALQLREKKAGWHRRSRRKRRAAMLVLRDPGSTVQQVLVDEIKL